MKKNLVILFCLFPLMAQAEVCLNDGCSIMVERKAYDEKILPEWNRLKTLSEKLPSGDSQIQFILDNYSQWRDVSIAECTFVQESFPDLKFMDSFKSTCMNNLIDIRVFFLKSMSKKLEAQVQP